MNSLAAILMTIGTTPVETWTAEKNTNGLSVRKYLLPKLPFLIPSFIKHVFRREFKALSYGIEICIYLKLCLATATYKLVKIDNTCLKGHAQVYNH